MLYVSLKIISISPAGDNQTQTYRLWVKLPYLIQNSNYQ